MHSKMPMTCFVQGTSLRQNSLDGAAFPASMSCCPQRPLSKLNVWRCVLQQPDFSKIISERLLRARFNHANEYHSLIRFGNLEGLPMELINGRIMYMLSQSGRHSNVVDKLQGMLGKQIDRSVRVRSEKSISLVCDSKPSEPIPAISVVKDIKYGDNHPSASDTFFVAEVAKTSVSNDMREKLDLYANSGIPEYWIIDVSNNSARNWNIRVHKDLKGNHYQYKKVFNVGSGSLSAFPNCAVNLKELFDI